MQKYTQKQLEEVLLQWIQEHRLIPSMNLAYLTELDIEGLAKYILDQEPEKEV